MGTYVMSDIHGCYHDFLKMLKKIQFQPGEDTLYILGDILDRGPNVADMLRWVWENESEHVIMLKGNHEAMFYEYPDPEYYKEYFEELTATEMYHLISWIPSLPVYRELTLNGIDYILVHAGMTKEILETGEDPTEECLWMRNEFYLGDGIPGKKIVFGHTPMMSVMVDDEDKVHIWRSENQRMIGIDTGCVFRERFGGKLACLRLEDEKEFYI